MRSGSPLVSHGPRKTVPIALQADTNVAQSAARHGVTRRLVMDELLLDTRLVELAAKRVAKRVQLQKVSEKAPTGQRSQKRTHQDCAGRTLEAPDDP